MNRTFCLRVQKVVEFENGVTTSSFVHTFESEGERTLAAIEFIARPDVLAVSKVDGRRVQ